MTLKILEQSISKCDLCKNILSEYGVTPKPIFSGTQELPIMLVGQAPGITEYKTGLPFQGSAGKSIKNLFSHCGLDNFNDIVYQTSITKCFPGRKKNLSVDRKPSKIEVDNCISFLVEQIKFIKPKIIVCLGMLSWKSLITLKEKDEKDFCKNTYNKTLSQLLTKDIVGKVFQYKNITILAMIHPSGAANGSRAKNKLEHEKSIKLLKKEILLINSVI